jgi:hypothetical protein
MLIVLGVSAMTYVSAKEKNPAAGTATATYYTPHAGTIGSAGLGEDYDRMQSEKAMKQYQECLESGRASYCFKERCGLTLCRTVSGFTTTGASERSTCSPQISALTYCLKQVADTVCPDNMNKYWDPYDYKAKCQCKERLVDHQTGQCLTVAEYLQSLPACAGHAVRKWRGETSECLCEAPFFKDPVQGNRCSSVAEALNARPACPKNMTKTWNNARMDQECRCNAPYITDEKSGECVTLEEMVKRIPKCTQGKVAFWSKEKGEYVCRCRSDSAFWNLTKRCTTPLEQAQYCFDKFNAVLVGSGSGAYCDCAKGDALSARNGRCVSAEELKAECRQTPHSFYDPDRKQCACHSPFRWNDSFTACVCPKGLTAINDGCVNLDEQCEHQLPGSILIKSGGKYYCRCPKSKGLVLDPASNRCVDGGNYCQSRIRGSHPVWRGSKFGCSCRKGYYIGKKSHRCIKRKRRRSTRTRHHQQQYSHHPNPASTVLPVMNMIYQMQHSRHHHHSHQRYNHRRSHSHSHSHSHPTRRNVDWSKLKNYGEKVKQGMW